MKKSLALSLSVIAFLAASAAHADTGYTPYYYTAGSGDTVNAGQTVTVAAATEVAIAPKTSQPATVTVQAPVDNTVYNYAPHPTPSYQPQSHDPHYADGAAGPTQVAKSAAAKDADDRATVPSLQLGTRPGVDVALQVSNYHYREPGLDVSLAGEKGGIDAALVAALPGKNFLTFDARYVMGASDYSGSGHSSDHFERLLDIRPLVSHDFTTASFNIAPFIGIGYRNLYSNDQGVTVVNGTTFGGYRRNNDLFYVPMGVNTQWRLSQNNRLSVSGEYDYVFLGTQTSYLSDIGNGDPDIKNMQHHGNGFRTAIMWDRPGWSIGPFANYWAIAQSDVNSACGTALCDTGYEPHNNTLEVGLQAKFHPFNF